MPPSSSPSSLSPAPAPAKRRATMRVGCEDKPKDEPAHRPAGQAIVSREAAMDRLLRLLRQQGCSVDTRPALAAAFAAAATAVLAGSGAPPVSADDLAARDATLGRGRAQLLRLLECPGIAQRTPEWYEARHTMVTASDVAQALGCAKFGNQRSFFQKKCGLPEEQGAFDATLPPLRWGVMFEPVAQALYSSLNGGCRVHEFGLLRHPTLPFVGASPDGITDDGVMLEIKCPWRRKIVDGEVPMQYYYQIQAQLDVCGLAECDYFECELAEAQQDPLGPTGVVDCEWERAAKEGKAGALVCSYRASTEVGKPPIESYSYAPAHVAASRLPEAVCGWAYGECRRILQQQMQDAQQTTMEPKVVWWVLRKAACTRVYHDAPFCRDMFERLRTVWDRAVDYRGDRDRYLSEVGAAVLAAASGATKAGEVTAGHAEDDAKAAEAFSGGFAFI